VVSMLLVFLLDRRSGLKLLLGALLATAIFVGASLVFKPELVSAAVDRIFSVGLEGGASSSFGWRLTENAYAFPAIRSSPVFGLGLGAEYKPRLIDYQLFTEQTRYIHNAYLFILLKCGFVGLFLVVANHFLLMATTLRIGRLSEVGSAPRVAFLGVLMAVPLLSFTQPELFSTSTISVLAILAPVAWVVNLSSRVASPLLNDSSVQRFC